MEYPVEVRERLLVVQNMLTILHQHHTNSLAAIRHQVNIVFMKGTVSRDFPPHFFKSKNSTWVLMNRLKQFRQLFRFCEDIHEIHVSALSATTRTGVSVVVDYADTMSA